MRLSKPSHTFLTNKARHISITTLFHVTNITNLHIHITMFMMTCFLPSFGSFGQGVSEFFFKNRPIRNKNCLWRPCLLMDQDEMGNLYRGPSIDDSYQVSFHLAMRFQRRLFINRPIRNRQRTPNDGKSSHCLWQVEQKRQVTF